MSSSMADQEKESQREADGAREELHAILSARHELGTEYNDELADMLMERLDAVIDRRVEARLQDVSGSDMSPAVPICSFIFAIPATASWPLSPDPWVWHSSGPQWSSSTFFIPARRLATSSS